MKHLHFWILPLLGICCSCMFLACNDDEDDASEGKNDNIVDLSDAQRDSINYENLINTIAPYDTTQSLPERVVRLAKSLYPEHPDEYYTMANSTEDALEHFLNAILPADLKDNATTVDNVTKVSVKDATLTFSPASDDGKVAVVSFDIPELEIISKLYYLQEGAWPNNDDLKSPFTRYEIWQHNATKKYYICVQDAVSCEGILLSFNIDNSNRAEYGSYWQSDKHKDSRKFYLYKNCASKDAYYALYLMSHQQPSKFKAKLDNLISTKAADDYAKTLNNHALKFYNGTSNRYMIGTASTDKILYWAHWYIYFKFDYFDSGSGKSGSWETYKQRKTQPPFYDGAIEARFNMSSSTNGWTKIVK